MPRTEAALIEGAEATPNLRALILPARAAAAGNRRALLDPEWESLVTPGFSYTITPASVRSDGTVSAGGLTFPVPAFADDAAAVEAVAAGVCTIGADIEGRCSALFQERRPSLALTIDELGTLALFRLKDHVLAAIRGEASRAGLVAGTEVSPGDPGLSLEWQATVLALAQAEGTGVSIAGRATLSPAKSVTFVVALGRNLKRPTGSRCDRCPARNRCRLR
jgi:hypothetical protein